MGKMQKVARRSETVHLFIPQDQDRLAELAAEVDQAAALAQAEGGARRLTDAPVQEAAEAYDAFLVEAIDRAVHADVVALPGRAWRELLAAHPPRKPVMDGDTVVDSFPEDEQYGFNVESIANPLVLAALEPSQFDDDAEKNEWVDDLSDPHFSKLFSAAVRVNTDGGPDPKFRASSWLAQTSAVMSRLDSASTGPQASSTESPERIASS